MREVALYRLVDVYLSRVKLLPQHAPMSAGAPAALRCEHATEIIKKTDSVVHCYYTCRVVLMSWQSVLDSRILS